MFQKKVKKNCNFACFLQGDLKRVVILPALTYYNLQIFLGNRFFLEFFVVILLYTYETHNLLFSLLFYFLLLFILFLSFALPIYRLYL